MSNKTERATLPIGDPDPATALQSPKKAAPSPERPPDGKSATPRRLSSPDIQALAKIDRILAGLTPEMALATINYLTTAAQNRWMASQKPKTAFGPEEGF